VISDGGREWTLVDGDAARFAVICHLLSVICHSVRRMRLTETGVLERFDDFATEKDEQDGYRNNAENGASH
jgi:hypothetical protein